MRSVEQRAEDNRVAAFERWLEGVMDRQTRQTRRVCRQNGRLRSLVVMQWLLILVLVLWLWWAREDMGALARMVG